MNVEQLHAVCQELRNEIHETNFIGTLQELAEALQQSVAQPQSSQFQEKIGVLREQLHSTLSAIESDSRPVTTKAIIEEIGATDLLGENLLQQINESFQQLDVTPSLVHNDVGRIVRELSEFQKSLDGLLAGFRSFGISADTLSPYTAELGVLIPRGDNRESLRVFAADVRKLNGELQPFHELVTGKSADFRIRSLSSSDLAMFLDVLPETAAAIVGTVWALTNAYDKFLDIRLKRKELSDAGVPDESLEPIDSWAAEIISKQVDEITRELMDEFEDVERPSGRRNEVEGLLKLSIKKLAGRLDVGYHFSARVGEPEEPEADESEDEAATEPALQEFYLKQEVAKSINQDASKLALRRMGGDPILPLDWHPDCNGEPEE